MTSENGISHPALLLFIGIVGILFVSAFVLGRMFLFPGKWSGIGGTCGGFTTIENSHSCFPGLKCKIQSEVTVELLGKPTTLKWFDTPGICQWPWE